MTGPAVSERVLVLAPQGRDSLVATEMLSQSGLVASAYTSLPALLDQIEHDVGLVVVTEEALATTDLKPLAAWIEAQEEWSDLPFVLLTRSGGGLERNPAARRYLAVLGNVTFLERPFHPMTLVSLAEAALRGRRRQYEARARLAALRDREEELARGQARFQAITDSIDQMIWSTRPDGYHDYYNQRWYDYTGVAEGSTDGEAWKEMFHPDDRERAWATWRRSLATGEPYHIEYRLRHRSGDYRWTLGRAHPVRDEHGEIIRWYGTCTEIDAEVRARETLAEAAETLEQKVDQAVADRESALAQLHEAQKLEMLGQLTGGVAHDFNNLLTPITGALDMLQRRHAGEDPRLARLIDGALQSAERAKTLVHRLLGFARRQSLQTRAVDLGELVEGIRDLVASSIGPSIELGLALTGKLPPALADPNQLELAILNLCVNARDAMPAGGVLTIAAELALIDQRSALKLSPGAYVRLSVIDSGLGMDEATLGRAIEPFYSTKGVGKGTGLGLSMVHGLAAQLGGDLVLTSAVGEGTRADLYLPVARAAAEPLARPRLPLPDAARRLSVLLVDDEELVRTGTAEMLRDFGHRVTTADSGADALSMLATGLEVDVIVTDYMMPRMNGAELAKRCRALNRHIPTLIITGYAGEDLPSELRQLAKPFRQDDLAAALQALVEEGGNVVPFPLQQR